MFGRAKQILQAYRDIGMRASYSYAVRDQSRMLYASDEVLLESLPESLSRQIAEILQPQQFPFADNVTLYDRLVEENLRSGSDQNPTGAGQSALVLG